jgi:hypothetical protein
MRLSSGPALGREPTDAAMALSSGPPSERRAACGLAIEPVVVEASLSMTSTSTTAAAASSANSVETATTQWARSWVLVDMVGLPTCDMTDLLGGI